MRSCATERSTHNYWLYVHSTLHQSHWWSWAEPRLQLLFERGHSPLLFASENFAQFLSEAIHWVTIQVGGFSNTRTTQTHQQNTPLRSSEILHLNLVLLDSLDWDDLLQVQYKLGYDISIYYFKFHITSYNPRSCRSNDEWRAWSQDVQCRSYPSAGVLGKRQGPRHCLGASWWNMVKLDPDRSGSWSHGVSMVLLEPKSPLVCVFRKPLQSF